VGRSSHFTSCILVTPSPIRLLEEILALTKLNGNSARYAETMPMTNDLEVF
jgi:hypothetical protein